MALDECSPVSEWVLRELTQHWARMVAAWSVMDRDEYVKAVNDFSVAAAVLATGLDIAENDKNR
jgi:pyocin large subunit-like protein